MRSFLVNWLGYLGCSDSQRRRIRELATDHGRGGWMRLRGAQLFLELHGDVRVGF
jgi:hypothetical protein